MARFTPPTISGYNASPPADDGSEVASNQVKWSTHKDKLADPLKTYAEGIVTAVTAMDGKTYCSGVTTTATNLTLTAASHTGKNVRVTGTSTITLPEAASASTTFTCMITKADSSGTVTVATPGSETIDGAASITLTSLGEAVGIVTDGTNWFVDARYHASLPLPREYISGLVVTSNGSDADHDIDIATGVARDFADSVNIDLTAALTKQINANWAEGTNAGGFPSGLTLANSTAYRVFAIVDEAGGVDVGFDTSATATNLLADATDYIAYREIAGVVTDGSANIARITPRQGVSVQVFTASGTWTKGAGCRAARVRVQGGGGGGGGSNSTNRTGGGGAAGGYLEKMLDATALTSATITIGAAGSAGTTSGAGGTGGTTTWSDGTNTLTTTGGAGGIAGAVTVTGARAAGGTATGGDINMVGQSGGPMGGNESSIANWSDGGSGPLGFGGKSSQGIAGEAGKGNGAGGSGGSDTGTDRAGGAGTAGIVIVEEFY